MEGRMRAKRTGWAAAVMAVTVGAGTASAADPAHRAAVSAPRRVVVSIPDRKLAVIENDEVVSLYRVAVGAATSPSPTGTFTIVNRIPNPTYYTPGKIVGPGARNPLGTRWIGLNQKGYGIHGTDQPKSIGYARSHGCIRLRNEDIEQLFERVRPGDIVELHAEPTPEIARLFQSDPSPDSRPAP
jgi:lipoprotein-anchoring transpeptidase ErfK/SrfK